MGWLRRWDEEYGGDGGQELWRNGWGKWDVSLWLCWTNWHFGVSIEREFGSFAWADRLHLSLSLGPLHLGAVRTWNDPT